MIKKILLLLMLITLFVCFYVSVYDISDFISYSSKEYFINNAISETGSNNIVTAIYLDYRLFDSIFEASILLIVVSGIIFISKKDDEII
ncbi:hydrogen gas-evolving membrane-bound hydrogenase subunit E [Maledivibacter halophilus]|uniref:Multicomponent Na+:H+ antiporter subunit B n=1 Tax=Maledivibacter halophilus TaxID=36842 RepID=A0A1T5KMQ9_9FIRM|nr:hydrogen gas-evolving membrane-bound hydrogenase subunit E [Maledivibacter halophilus]SKC64911.1 multicomponent Na+:H+ antiporter subunit B [Maledivibacter halophilus]